MIDVYKRQEFPLWLAPAQAIVLPISDPFNDYGSRVRDTLQKAGLRVELDGRSESIGKKIREAELRKIDVYKRQIHHRSQGNRNAGTHLQKLRFGQGLPRPQHRNY